MFFVDTVWHNKLLFPLKFYLYSVFRSGQDEFLERQDEFFQPGNQPISVRHLSQPYNKYDKMFTFLIYILRTMLSKAVTELA